MTASQAEKDPDLIQAARDLLNALESRSSSNVHITHQKAGDNAIQIGHARDVNLNRED